jgi:hypothetical protein
MNRRSFIGLLRDAGPSWLIAALFVVAALAAAIPALAHSSHPLVCCVKMEFFPGALRSLGRDRFELVLHIDQRLE